MLENIEDIICFGYVFKAKKNIFKVIQNCLFRDVFFLEFSLQVLEVPIFLEISICLSNWFEIFVWLLG
jgi:hypothetical protein